MAREREGCLRGGTATSVGTVTTDDKGTRYINFGGGGAPLYGFAGTQPVWLQKRESTHGYAIASVTAASFAWKSFREDGSAIDQFKISK